jgi:hypothetical protein
MSVLSFPRIYFKGFIGWDPCTFNNNDWQEFQTYDPVNAALNWPFLATQAVTPQNPDGITPQNFQTTFRPWAIELQPDDGEEPNSPNGARVPAEWNMFGTHNVSFVQYGDFKTLITGGALGYGQPVTADSLIGAQVAIGGSGSPAKLVDTNPASFWSSQIYFGQLAFGSGSAAIVGPRNFRMHSRWLDLNRIYTSDQSLTQPAASVGCCFQTCVPYGQVTWPTEGNSALAAKLKSAASQSPALGIMVRFTAYVNVYFQNGIFNGTKIRPSTYKDLAGVLADAWKAWNASGGKDTSLFFSNPCYSNVVGTLGVWNEGEVASAPVGRYLSAAGKVAAIAQQNAFAKRRVGYQAATMAAATAAPAAPPLQVTLGPVVANIDYDNEIISLDLNSTMPENGTPGEMPSDLSKADFGPLDLGVSNSAGGFTSIYQIPYSQYAREAYEASAGIIDIPFADTTIGSGVGAFLNTGTLSIQVQSTPALVELQYSAQTDSRGIYIDEGGSADFDITVYNFGVPSPNTNVMVAQYDANLSLIPTNGSPLVYFANGEIQNLMSGGTTTTVTTLTTNGDGVGNCSIGWSEPGFAVLAFFPYSGNTIPGPPISLLGPCQTTSGSITYAFYTTVRALPADDGVPQQFVDLWNSTNGDQTQAWNFIYTNILYIYDMLFNVMLKFVNLGDQSAFARKIVPIWSAISAENAVEGTTAMPITRDLSAGKRLTLQLWIYLIANDYKVADFNVNSIPADWTPSS